MKNASSKLGSEKGVYRVKFGLGYFGMYALCLGFSGIGLLIFLAANTVVEKIGLGVLFAFLSLPLIFLLIRTVPTAFDELRIFENGFTYKSRKGLQTCLWNQVKDGSFATDFRGASTVTSVIKRNKEKIVFAFKMRGLSILCREIDGYEFSQIPESEKITENEAAALEPTSLGALQATYHTKGSWTSIFPLVALLFVAAFGVIIPIANENIWLVPTCSLPPAILFIAFLWSTIRERKDELTVYENGFTYLSGKEFSKCLWHEIVDYSTVRHGPQITGVKKEDGTWINISSNIQGNEELKPHMRTLTRYADD